MTDRPLPPEFLLVAACCRWPLSEPAIAAIHQANNTAIDWPYFMRVVLRHRVGGLVHNALITAGIDPPPDVASGLARSARQIAQKNLLSAAETVRLQGLLDAAAIPVMVLKGVALAQLAYGSLEFKHARDIDLLVPQDRVEAALQLLERSDYALVLWAGHLSPAQRRAAIRYGKEIGLVHRDAGFRVDLQWRLTGNPFSARGRRRLFAGAGDRAHRHDRPAHVADDDLFAYLSAHGAHHAWFRLKWLADFNALIAEKTDADIVRLYRHAQSKGAGLCAGQALLLCHRLMGLKLPDRLAREFDGNKRLARLVAIALRAGIDSGMNRGMVGAMRNMFTPFLLGRGWPYFAAQCRISSVGLIDAIRLPLPAPLHFLLPDFAPAAVAMAAIAALGVGLGLEFLAHDFEQRIGCGVEFNAADIERGGGGHVVVLVADQEAAAKIDRPFARGLFEHAGCRACGNGIAPPIP